jgi:signal transduction histidine kinase
MKRRDAIAVLIAGAIIVFGLLTVFAVELSNNQAKSKADIESRVHERSVLAAALIDSLFQTSATTAGPQDAKLYGAPTVSPRLLEHAKGHSLYAVLLDSSGNVVAQSSGFTPQARGDLARSAALRLLRGGYPWALGNVLPYGRTGVVNYGIRLATPSGTRYLLSGFVPTSLGPFLIGELREIPGVKGSHNYVLDSNGEILASTNPVRPAGYVFHTPAQLSVLHHSSGDIAGHYFDQVTLSHTSWRILLTAPNGPLFASVSGLRKWVPWLIFAAFGIVALIALLLARRAMRAGQEIRDANAKLGVANAQLATTNEELAGSNEELGRRAQELARSNAELDQFASIASHDLQEPLRKVRTFTERIKEIEADALSERGLDYLERAGASAERMQHLIEDLLKFSRVATQGRPFKSIDLGVITAEVLEDLDDAVRRSGAVIHVGDLPKIKADRSQMRQLLQNLLSNALKFTREDVTTEIDVSATIKGEMVEIVIADNGIGFDPQYSRRIFRVFERLHGRGSYPGTGIGLALCRKIAERHGGTVEAQSVPGEGSTFTVTMQTHLTEPVSDVPPAIEAVEPAKPEEPYVAV